MRGAARWTIVMSAAFAAACGTVPLDPPLPEAAPARRIAARVGTLSTGEARTAVVANPIFRMEVGRAAVQRFEAAFDALFTQTTRLPDWPPWRESARDVDGVIVLERVNSTLTLGDDVDRPDVTTVTARVCLYDATGPEAACWTASGRLSRQRVHAECLDLRRCHVPQMEAVLREAVADFLDQADRSPELAAWAARLPARPRP